MVKKKESKKIKVTAKIKGKIVITQDILEKYLKLKKYVEKLKLLNESIKEELNKGTPVEEGPIKAWIDEVEKRKVNWKGLLEEKIGKDKVKEIWDNAPKTKEYHLQVKEIR